MRHRIRPGMIRRWTFVPFQEEKFGTPCTFVVLDGPLATLHGESYVCYEFVGDSWELVVRPCWLLRQDSRFVG